MIVSTTNPRRLFWSCLVLVGLAGCNTGVTIPGDALATLGDGLLPGDGVLPPGGGTTEPALVSLEVYASATNGATAIALRSDGALFLVNVDGLFGPIMEGSDVSMEDPLGATNLADNDLFDTERPERVLAITDDGEFWIGTPERSTLGVVAPEGGPAVPFEGLLQGSDPSNIKPETMAIVPTSFDGPQIDPGNLLVGEETAFSRLSAIDVADDRAVVNVDNPLDPDDPAFLNRQAHHLTFGPDGRLYSAGGGGALTMLGLQEIAEDGTPTGLPGTFGVLANSFVVLDSNEILYVGSLDTDPAGSPALGLFIWSPTTEEVVPALSIAPGELSGDEELVISTDRSMIFMASPATDTIFQVVDER